MLLSLFCGAGGLDLGFEQAGFSVGLAFDKKRDSVASYNENRASNPHAYCRDVRDLSLDSLDELWGTTFQPEGVIGGPPCQSFSQANRSVALDDPRHELPLVYAKLVRRLHQRSPLKFIAMENVPGLSDRKNVTHLLAVEAHLRESGFQLYRATLNAKDYSTPQSRRRLFLIGLNKTLFPGVRWNPPTSTTVDPSDVSVKSAIWGLPDPVFYQRGIDSTAIPFHPNHWCMTPKSKRFCSETEDWTAGSWSFPALALRPKIGPPEAGVFRLLL